MRPCTVLTPADTPRSRLKALVRGALGLIAAAFLLDAGLGAWQRWRVPGSSETAPTSSPKAAPAPVRVATVEAQDFPVVLTGLGTAQATNTVTVRSRVDGQVLKVAFAEGQMLKEGDLLREKDREARYWQYRIRNELARGEVELAVAEASRDSP